MRARAQTPPRPHARAPGAGPLPAGVRAPRDPSGLRLSGACAARSAGGGGRAGWGGSARARERVRATPAAGLGPNAPHSSAKAAALPGVEGVAERLLAPALPRPRPGASPQTRLIPAPPFPRSAVGPPRPLAFLPAFLQRPRAQVSLPFAGRG